MIFDNRALGMVHQWQKLFYDGRFSETVLDPVPDFVKLADAYGWQAARVSDPSKIDGAIDEMLAADGPFLLDVAISENQNVFPMVPAGGNLARPIGVIDMTRGGVRVDDAGADEEGGRE